MAEFIFGGILMAVLWCIVDYSSKLRKPKSVQWPARVGPPELAARPAGKTPVLEVPVIPTVIPTVADLETEIIIIPEYNQVVEEIKRGTPATFVTGRAGTGKSTMIRFLLQKIPNCVVVAPTGIAAINVGGVTIHSFFGFPPQILNSDQAYNPRSKMIPIIEVLGALIVDEVSMVPPDQIDCMDQTLQKVRRNRLPFGGVPVVFVGDLLQLPPVVSNQPAAGQFYSQRYPSAHFFQADVFREMTLKSIELTKVFRQAQCDFVEMLDTIRRGKSHRESVARFNRECYRDKLDQPKKEVPEIFLVPRNVDAKAINTRKLNAMPGCLHTFDAEIEGDMRLERARFQAPIRLEIKEGAQVMFVKNNAPYWMNGTLGRVIEINEHIIRVDIPGSGNKVSVQRATWEKVELAFDRETRRIITTVVGIYRQFPLMLGWAITIHKSQGMTLDSVRIDMSSGAFISGQTYVALSRCKTLEGITLDVPLSMGWIMVDQMALDFLEGQRKPGA